MIAKRNEVGSISWIDLTIQNADEVRDFYSKVAGWKFEYVSMGEYSDYSMLTPNTKKATAGICHAMGANKNLPPQWLVYITVANIDDSVSECVKLGGKLISEINDSGGGGKFCVIKDPAGAVCALLEEKK